MAWRSSIEMVKISKANGKCYNKAMWKYCPYWMAQHSVDNPDRIIGYRCSLFDKELTGDKSLPECNERYGQTYNGLP
jgi:hypothetical protein